MKKLLSLLSVLTISGTTVPSIIAASPYQKYLHKIVKREENNFSEELTNNKKNIYSDFYIEKFTNIESDTKNVAVDSKENIFLYKNEKDGNTYSQFNLYILKKSTTIPSKINGIDGEVKSIVIFNDDAYIIASNNSFYNSYERNNLYVLKQGETSATKIYGININEIIISLNVYNDSLYIGTNNPNVRNEEIVNYLYVGPKKYNVYVLKKDETTPTEINFKSFSAKDTLKEIGVTKNGDIYFVTDKGIDVLKNGTEEVKKFKELDRTITSFIVDNNDNIYIGTDIFTYMLKNNGEFTKVYRIEEGIKNILIDNKNNAYFINNRNDFYLLSKNKIKSLSPTVKKIDKLEGNINIWNSFIDKVNNRIYFATSNGPYIFKNN